MYIEKFSNTFFFSFFIFFVCFFCLFVFIFCFFYFRVHLTTGKVDLSLRLSQVDPEAAKRKSDRKKRKEVKARKEEALGSDGGSDQEELG